MVVGSRASRLLQGPLPVRAPDAAHHLPLGCAGREDPPDGVHRVQFCTVQGLYM